MITAHECALLANDVYNAQRESHRVGQWIRVRSMAGVRMQPHGPTGMLKTVSTGFYGAYYRNPENEIVVAFRGTEPTDLEDLGADACIGLKVVPRRQADDARSFFDSVRQANPESRIVLTGHSLGGFLAKVVASQTGATAITFNAPGISGMAGIGPHTGQIINLVAIGDKINGVNQDAHRIVVAVPTTPVTVCSPKAGYCAPASDWVGEALRQHEMARLARSVERDERLAGRDVEAPVGGR